MLLNWEVFSKPPHFQIFHLITDGCCAFSRTHSLLPACFHEISLETVPFNIYWSRCDIQMPAVIIQAMLKSSVQKKKPLRFLNEENFYTWKASNLSDIHVTLHKAEYSIRSKSYSDTSSLHNSLEWLWHHFLPFTQRQTLFLRLLLILCNLQLHNDTNAISIYVFQIFVSSCIPTTGISHKYVTCKYLPRHRNCALVQILVTCPFPIDCR